MLMPKVVVITNGVVREGPQDLHALLVDPTLDIDEVCHKRGHQALQGGGVATQHKLIDDPCLVELMDN